MAEYTPTTLAREAVNALPLAMKELDHALSEREFVANRVNVANLTVTYDVPGSLPRHFHLEGEAADAVRALFDGLTAARVEAARALVRSLTDQIQAGAA